MTHIHEEGIISSPDTILFYLKKIKKHNLKVRINPNRQLYDGYIWKEINFRKHLNPYA